MSQALCRVKLGLALGAASWTLAASQVEAQEGAQAESGAANSGLAEIIVTAERRSENLNDVGLSIVAATGDELQSRGVASTADLVKIVPGLTYTETPYGTGVLTLRGIGFYESSLAASSPVATYIDEIPIPYPRMAAGTTLDVERVEVLKGPQGTLYGQNTTGGLINYIAAKPTSSFAGGINASIGRFMETDVEAFVSGPLGDTLGARVAIRSRQSDGWQKSATRLDDDLGAAHMLMGRLLVDWKPSDRLSLEFNANGFIDKSDTQAGQAIGLFPGVPAAVQPQELTGVLIPKGSNRLADWGADKDFDKDNDYYQLAMKGVFAVSDAMDLISITAYQKYTQDQLVDADGSALETADVTQDGYIKSFSQELRVQGEAGPVKYVLGGNYSHDKIYDNTVFVVGDSSLAVGVPGLPIRFSRTWSYQTAKTWAAFGGVDLKLADSVTVQGSLRYTEQKRDFTGCIGDNGDGQWATLFSVVYGATILPGGCTTLNPFTGVIGPVSDTLNEDNWAWRVNVNFEPTPDVLLYAGVSRGYKAGSFPTVGGVVSVQYAPATQESVLAYEAGAKLTLADRRLQLNGAVFYYDYSDKQFRGKILDSFFGSIERLYNVPKSRVVGAELQVMAVPLEGLKLDANLSIQDSKIKSDFAGLTPIGTPTNLKGESFEFTPKLAMSGGFTYDRPVSDGINGFFGMNATHQSKSHAGYGGLPLFRIDAYTLVDARLGARDADDRWNAQLWVRNLFNQYYITNANYLGEFAYRLAGRPRTYGVSLGYRF